jgi:hypothetical protein
MGGTFAPINQGYLSGQDSAAGFDSPVIDMRKPTSAINYQFKWDAGVRGELTWYASIFSDPYVWETLVSCEEVRVTVKGNSTSSIVALPVQWLTAGFIKFSWVPAAGTDGNIDAAIRIVPI